MQETVFEKTDFQSSVYSVSNSVSILVIQQWIKWKEKVFWSHTKKGHLKSSESVNHWNLSEEGDIISGAVIQSQSYQSVMFNVHYVLLFEESLDLFKTQISLIQNLFHHSLHR